MPLSLAPFADLPYVVAPMRVPDIEEVTHIDHLSFPTPWSFNSYYNEIERNRAAHYFVLRLREAPQDADDQESGWRRLQRWLGVQPGHERRSIIGYAGMWMMHDEAHISTIAIHPDWRGHALGEYMLLAMIAQAQALKAVTVTLEVRVTNTRAQSLYLKYHFEVVGRRRGYYSDNGEDALLMTTPFLNSPEYDSYLNSLAVALRKRLQAHIVPAERENRVR
ncbi:MAG: ribosomal protein S18-alanine N-acetyltransferase [Anaerolineae bacterium]